MRIITPLKQLADHSDEWLSKDKPEWFKESDIDSLISTRFCPSFVELFKNSLVFRAPADMRITLDENQRNYTFHIAAAPLIRLSSHDLARQMNSNFAEKWESLKMSLPVTVLSDKVESLIFMPSDYHLSDSPLQAMLGILETIPNKGQELTINFKVDKRMMYERNKWMISRGTPLAYFYFPNGAPKEVEYLSRDEFESLTWIQTEFNCQYLRELTKAKKSLDT